MTDGLSNLSILRRNWPEYVDPRTTHLVDVAGVLIGEARPVVIAGPCAVESYEQTLSSLARVPIRSRAWAKRASTSWREFARRLDSGS